MTSGNDSKVASAVRTMDFAEFVAYLKENKEAFSDARVSLHSTTGTKRQTMQKNKATDNGSSILKPKKQKSHVDGKVSTLDSFVIKVQSPRSSTAEVSYDTEESASMSADNLADFAKASPMSLKTLEVASPTISGESRYQESFSTDTSALPTDRDGGSVEIDLTRSDSSSSTALSNENR
ncbi:conserved hypothetical protein [Echinococcus multilocularis]|uniref:Uncharacterized protein n=1 Tax=Echinococcus multilocularis TaxID=6211 RepID=A0A068YE47_ECHMU|nr:conserved hypothetical protein [Echinococcus multilocularis]